MSRYRPSNPVARRRVFCRLESPFPVPIQSVTGTPCSLRNWSYYTGRLHGNSVKVTHSGDMECLFKMGFFGKGNLSRFGPEYNHGFWGVKRRRREGDGEEVLRVISRRKYLRHLAWNTQRQTQAGTLPKEAYTKELEMEDLSIPVNMIQDNSQTLHEIVNNQDKLKSKPDTHPVSDDKLCLQTRVGSVIETDQSEESLQGEHDKEFSDWRTVGEGEVDPWAEDNWEESNTFWGTEENATPENKLILAKHDTIEKMGQEGAIDASVEISALSQSGQESHKASRCRTEESTLSEEMSNTSSHLSEKAVTECDTPGRNSTSSDIVRSTKMNITHEMSDCGGGEENSATAKMEAVEVQENVSVTPAMRSHDVTVAMSCDVTKEATTPADDITSASDDVTNVGATGMVADDLDPLCLEEEENGDLLVADDTDESGDESHKANRHAWLPTRKRDPFKLKECLVLTLEEAFFLSYGLGCLVVLDENDKPLNLTQMWRIFQDRQSSFISDYLVFHNLRSKGWVPKCGSKVGAKYVVYKKGPPFYHSSFSVLVRTVKELDLKVALGSEEATWSWPGLAGRNRVTEQVAKEILLCYVIVPDDLTEEERASPKCITRHKIQEVVVKRWISSQEREQRDSSEHL